MLKKVSIAILIVITSIQFVRPPKNTSSAISENDISVVYKSMPKEIHSLLIKKCYDCHSNNTVYPWYSAIQPLGWWLNHHIEEGKEHLNFSEFGIYSEKRAKHKLEELSDAVTNGWMPLDSYMLMHPETKITPEETTSINSWIVSVGVKVGKQDDNHD